MTDANPRKAGSVKCVVWDLDNTLWHGVLIEGDEVRPRSDVVRIIQELDRRGILQSVASKNDPELALARLDAFGLGEYFLYPQVGWGAKSASIKAIAEAINIGMDAIAFVDDQPFELEEVRFTHPQVLCISADALDGFLERPEMNPRFVTEDARNRRRMYRADEHRKRQEDAFTGPKEDFLASLGMRFSISRAREEDLQRAEELTVRTNQLNATGYTYSYEELAALRVSDRHLLLISELEDRFGTYGKIGLALVERRPDAWILKLLLMSCRVMSRGVGTVLLHHVMARARDAGVRLLAEFVPTDRNRVMYVTYKFAGFSEVSQEGKLLLLESDLSRVQPPPAYVEVHVAPGA